MKFTFNTISPQQQRWDSDAASVITIRSKKSFIINKQNLCCNIKATAVKWLTDSVSSRSIRFKLYEESLREWIRNAHAVAHFGWRLIKIQQIKFLCNLSLAHHANVQTFFMWQRKTKKIFLKKDFHSIRETFLSSGFSLFLREIYGKLLWEKM